MTSKVLDLGDMIIQKDILRTVSIKEIRTVESFFRIRVRTSLREDGEIVFDITDKNYAMKVFSKIKTAIYEINGESVIE